jgi:hypothetical protein
MPNFSALNSTLICRAQLHLVPLHRLCLLHVVVALVDLLTAMVVVVAVVALPLVVALTTNPGNHPDSAMALRTLTVPTVPQDRAQCKDMLVLI